MQVCNPRSCSVYPKLNSVFPLLTNVDSPTSAPLWREMAGWGEPGNSVPRVQQGQGGWGRELWADVPAGGWEEQGSGNVCSGNGFQGRDECTKSLRAKSTWVWSVSSVAQSCPTLSNLMDSSMAGLPVHHQLSELAQTHVHQAGDAIQEGKIRWYFPYLGAVELGGQDRLENWSRLES